MATKLDSVVQDLKREEEKIKKQLAELKTQEKELNDELKRIEGGLSGLEGKARGKKVTAARSKKKGADPNREQVKEALVGLLREEGTVVEESLKAKVLKAVGVKTASVEFDRILGDVLQDEQFDCGPLGWRLTEFTITPS